MFAEVQYAAAAFEIFAGVNFILSPGALLDGYTPQSASSLLPPHPHPDPDPDARHASGRWHSC